MARRVLAVLVVVLAAALPYGPTIDDYFVQDDFGVVGLLSSKPAGFFPRWFVVPWMEDIWGYTPDEIRPFLAPTYQVAALWGAASPVANHAINIAFHAANGLLVLAVARAAAGLAPGPALFAALVFVLLPMQTESVAWVTGRVDSMPACLYLAAFLMYARWRSSRRPSLYAWSVLAYFLALFTKQNTVILLPAIVLYDALVAGRAVRASWAWLRPYVAFALLTAGFLGLRYVLFGEAAREGMLTAERFHFFLLDVSTHLRRMVFGEPGLRLHGLRAAALVGAVTAGVVAVGAVRGERGTARLIRPGLYFGVVWIGLALAPTVVAGYASPRHMYLASAGWALALGLALEVFWRARPVPRLRAAGVALALTVLVAYAVVLGEDVGVWAARAGVSRQAVADLEREAASAAPGTLIFAGAPARSWAFALPHAIRPPFTREDLTERVMVVSHSALHCCPAYLWQDYTRGTLRAWLSRPEPAPVVALHWNEETGWLSRVSDRDDPVLREMVAWVLEAEDVPELDTRILVVTDRFVGERRRTLPAR